MGSVVALPLAKGMDHGTRAVIPRDNPLSDAASQRRALLVARSIPRDVSTRTLCGSVKCQSPPTVARRRDGHCRDGRPVREESGSAKCASPAGSRNNGQEQSRGFARGCSRDELFGVLRAGTSTLLPGLRLRCTHR
jgi:hypothetical protein